jgi:hypothetical protein
VTRGATLVQAPRGVIPHRVLGERIGSNGDRVLLTLTYADRTSGTVALALLAGMGKSLRTTGAHSVRTDEHRTYAPVWLRAYGIKEVVLLDAQVVKVSAVLALLDLVPADIMVTLIAEGEGQTPLRLALQGHEVATQSVEWDRWLSALGPGPVDDAPGATPAGYGLDHLPNGDFLTFRWNAKTLNTAERFQAIDSDYKRAYTAASLVEASESAVIAHLAALTRNADTTAPIFTAVRATQAALFARGVLMQVHSDLLLGTLTSARPPRPTATDWKALRCYIRPERPATVALYLLGVAAQDLRPFTVGDARAALRSSILNGRPLPLEAGAILTAQLSRRVSEGAESTASFLDLRGERRHLEILIDARRELGLPIDGRNLRDDHTSADTRLLYRIGLKIRSLR